jgi:cell filamentation protein
LNHGQDKKFMAAKPGEIMGYLAHGHPFPDGNGRTIMVLHCVLAQRAGFSIDWAATNKNDYLAALTKELDDPHRGYPDAYLGRAQRIRAKRAADDKTRHCPDRRSIHFS